MDGSCSLALAQMTAYYAIAIVTETNLHCSPGAYPEIHFGWVYFFTARYYSPIYTSSLTTSAAISAQNNFQGLILGGYIYRYTPHRYAPVVHI